MTLHDDTSPSLAPTQPSEARENAAPTRSGLPYRIRRGDALAASELGRACGLGPATAQVLLHRGLDVPDEARAFLDPKLGGLTPPDSMADRKPAAERLARACKRGERVAVFGDYDVDGTTSAAILGDVLEALGAEVHTFVANRFEGGYGFSMPALERVLACKPTVLVTCDCGSSDHPRVEEARRRGVDVIVVDHHLVPDEPLPAVAFLNPHRPDCGFPYKGMCSAGLVFSLGAAIRAELGARLDLRAWLDLVALGTVADVAPLDGDNRALVRAGLRLLASDRVRPGVAALKDSARIRRGPMGAFDIAFRLAPRLNAPGRLADPTVTLELLRSRDPKEARRLAAQIEQLNDERKRIERHTTEEAIAQVEERYGPSPTHGVVAAGHGWHRGVVGISAARLVDRFDVPAIVIALEDGMGHGSGRTPEGFHLYEALAGCSEELERFGGHAAAAGLTIREERIDVFREAFSARAPRPEAGEALPLVDVELDAAYPLPTVEDLMRLEPLGEGNAQPVFAIRDAVVEESRIVADGQHLKLTLRHGRKILTAFGRDMAHRIDELGDTVTAIGHLRPDLWRGRGALELSLEKLLS